MKGELGDLEHLAILRSLENSCGGDPAYWEWLLWVHIEWGDEEEIQKILSSHQVEDEALKKALADPERTRFGLLRTVSFSPDGRLLASGSEDKTIRHWQIEWDYEFPAPTDWNEGARPYLENFLTLHTSYGPDGLSKQVENFMPKCIECKFEGKYFTLPEPYPIGQMLGLKLGIAVEPNVILIGFEEEAKRYGFTKDDLVNKGMYCQAPCGSPTRDPIVLIQAIADQPCDYYAPKS